jgi:hypothetical protein
MRSFVTLQIAGALTQGKADQPSSWRSVWIISVAIVVAEAVFYIFFASGEVQPWNNPQEVEEKKKEAGDVEN